MKDSDSSGFVARGLLRSSSMASIQKLPSGHYRIKWRDAAGGWQSETLRTKKLADLRRAEIELDSARGIIRESRRSRIAFGTYLDKKLKEAERELRPATLAKYRSVERYILPTLGGRQLGSIERKDLRDLYLKLEADGVGRPTVEVVHNLLSRTLGQAVDDDLIWANPAMRARKGLAHSERKPRRILSGEELCRLVYCLDRIGWIRGDLRQSHYYGSDRAKVRQLEEDRSKMRGELERISQGFDNDVERLEYVLANRGDQHMGLSRAAMLALLTAFTGLRFGEVAALRRRHVRFKPPPARVEVMEAVTEVGGVLSIGPTKTKGSRRSVPIASSLAVDALARYVEGTDTLVTPAFEPDDLLFAGQNGSLPSRTRYRARFWLPAVRFAALTPEPTFHDLRHSYGALLIEGNKHAKRLQERLGHSSIRTTMDVYGHLMPSLESDEPDLDGVLRRPSRGTYVARKG
jgi:Phage integrase family/Phage integrase, N-terminal SAM-like domain